MTRLESNLPGYGVVALLLAGFLSIVAGYWRLWKQAAPQYSKKVAFKKVFLASRVDPEMDRRALALIALGALTGALVFGSAFVWILFNLR